MQMLLFMADTARSGGSSLICCSNHRLKELSPNNPAAEAAPRSDSHAGVVERRRRAVKATPSLWNCFSSLAAELGLNPAGGPHMSSPRRHQGTRNKEKWLFQGR